MSLSDTLWWPAPAKLNLFLHITGQRSDGYHLLQTVFVLLDHGDGLSYKVNSDGEIRRIYAQGEMAAIPYESDLIVRAARLLQQHSGCTQGVEIDLQKRLPMGGGLGGGSSDAATTLVALNCLWKLGLSSDELAQLGLQLGADVPIFVHGHSAWAEGVGEVLEPIEVEEKWYLVIIPPVMVSTADIFSDSQLIRDTSAITIRDFLAGHLVSNTLEAIVEKRYPRVAEALKWLRQFAPAQMTGSGACVFAAFDSKGQAEELKAQMPEGWKGFTARGVNRSPLLTVAESFEAT
ncbi:MAG: 4-(cytidine 5'-diphospho)-2-C-methyl-D-erythritol kinase [Gammaproteobacteria bacterium]|nr:4-(cytidine 5'-diphospho)-2-C-methyl-D-erythritol kinase [Gammaproteobacteria bacterium]